MTRRISDEADRQRALELAVPDHRQADGGPEPPQGGVRGKLDLLLVGVGDERPAGLEHAPGDALAARHHDPRPVLGRVVARRGDPAARAVGEVDAGQRAADREVGLAAQGREHLVELQRGVEGDRGAGQRGVLLGARGAAALGLEQGERDGGLVGERLGERDLLRSRRRGARA